MFSLVNIFRTTELKDILIKKYIDGYWEEEDFKLLSREHIEKQHVFAVFVLEQGTMLRISTSRNVLAS